MRKTIAINANKLMTIKKPPLTKGPSHETQTPLTNTPNTSRLEHKLTREFLSGWAGGALSIFCTHPIDTVRVRMQSNKAPHTVTYSAIIRDLYNTGGLKSAYRGVIPPVTLRGFSMALNRSGYSLGTTALQTNNEKLPLGKLALVGGFSGLCQALGDSPLYLVKCRAQTSKNPNFKETFSTYWNMSRQISRIEGMRGWANGLLPASLCCITSYAVLYPTYETLLSHQWSPFTAGAVAGAISWPIGLPFDTLRVRMQCQPTHVSFRQVAKDMLTQPISKWFIGLNATMFRALPRYVICMSTIETLIKLSPN